MTEASPAESSGSTRAAAVLVAQLALLIAAGWVLGSLVEAVLGGGGSPRFDEPVVRFFAEHRTPWLTSAMRAVSVLGSTTVLIPLVAVAGISVQARTRSWSTLALLAVALGGAVVICDCVKPLVGRTRPGADLAAVTATGYAFPSGHTAQVTAVALTLAVAGAAWERSPRLRAWIWATAILVTVAVGFSRVYLGVHWPTDVLAGCALAALWATASALAFDRCATARRRRSARPAAP